MEDTTSDVKHDASLPSTKSTTNGRGHLPLQGCHVNCAGCAANFVRDKDLSYFGEVTDSVAQQLVDLHVTEIEHLREILQGALRTHGDLITTRWLKRSRDKRSQLLAAASSKIFGQWPPIPDSPDRDPTTTRPATTSPWDLTPWLRIGNITRDKSKLLALLHVRATNAPSAWAPFDTKASAPVFKHGVWSILYNERCVQMYGQDYGRMVPQNVDLMHAFAFMGFPRAVMTLQAQLQIMQALCGVVHNIIDGAAGTGNTKWGTLTAAGMKGSGTNMLFNAYTDQGFTHPLVFKPHSMLEKAKARLDLVLDEIELMQTDVAYMQAVLRTRKADIIRDSSGIDLIKLWGKHGLDLMAEFVSRVRAWQGITRTLQRVCDIFDEHAVDLTPGNKLNEVTNDAMFRLFTIIESNRRMQSYYLECEMPSTRSMRDHFTAREDGDMICMLPNDTQHPQSGANDRLKKFTDALRGFILTANFYDLSSLFTALQDELGDQGSSKPGDGHLLEMLSDLMLMDEMLTTWLFHQQVHLRLEEGEFPADKSVLYDEQGLSRDSEMTYIGPAAGVRVGRTVKEFMEMPWPNGRKDSAWFTKATECRRRLTSMWDSLRKELIDATAVAGHASKANDRSVAAMRFDTSLDHLADIEKEREQCEALTASDVAAALAKAKTSEELCPQTWNGGSRSKPVQRKKTKAKAARLTNQEQPDSLTGLFHGVSIRNSTTKQDELPDSTSSTPIPVKQESLAIFKKMFAASNAETKSDIRWDVFVQAMADAGFVATDASGSAVSFSNGRGRIVFHRPHPDPTIDPIMLHAMGRRLGKWFDWSAERFVLRERKEE